MKKIDFEAHFYNQTYMDLMYSRTIFPRFQQKTDTEVRKLWYFDDLGQPFTDQLLNHLLDVDQALSQLS